MRSRLHFRSNSPLRDENPSDFEPEGKALAEYLAAGLPGHGFAVKRIVMEDWGWLVAVDNKAFSLWIGCGFSGVSDDGLHCFIHPDKPRIWRWFRSIDVRPTVERLAEAIEKLIQGNGSASELSWVD